MAAIEEIPIESEVQPEKKEQEIEEIQEETPIKKSRGRPPGAKNKAKPKPAPPAPKPKAKIKKQKAPAHEEEDSDDSEDETPVPHDSGRRPPPIEVDRHALASEVLGILQHQRVQRTSARRNHYASWFENMS